MPALTKTTNVFGLLVDIETAYGDGGTPVPATHGVRLFEEATLAIGYENDGDRGGLIGRRVRVAPSGRTGTLTARVEGKGAGAAYSATVLPEEDALLRISGHQRTDAFGVGTENVVYAPESAPAGYESGGLKLYSRGQEYLMNGVYGTMSFSFDTGFWVWDFELGGIVPSDPTDLALPSITYSAVQPPQAQNITFDVGGVTGLVVRSLNYTSSRSRQNRLDINAATGLAGLAAGAREPQLEVVMETPVLATYNPFADWSAGTTRAISFTVGTAQYNKITWAAPQAQLIGVEEDQEDVATLVRASFLLPESSDGVNDDYTITYP